MSKKRRKKRSSDGSRAREDETSDAKSSAGDARREPDVSRGALPIELGFLARFAMTTVGGVLIFLSFPTYDVWPLVYISLPFLLIAIHDRTPRGAFGWGAWFGLVTNIGGFYWLTNLLEDFGHLPWWLAASLCTLLCLVQGFVFALWGWFIRRVQIGGSNLPVWAIAIPSMLALEFIFPMLFPWYLGNSQYLFYPAIQIAELLGVLGVSLEVLLINLALYEIVAWWLRRRADAPASFPTRFVAVAVVLYGAAIAFGVVRIGQIDAQMEAAETLEIGMVEGNIGIWEKEDAEKLDNNILIHQNLSAQLAEDGDMDLIVWPESSYQSNWIWGSTSDSDDVLFLELDSLFVPEYRDAVLPAFRALHVGFERRLDHIPVFHRAIHTAAAVAAMKHDYARVSKLDLMGGVRFRRARMSRPPYPYVCGERANMHLRCPYRRVPPDEVQFLLPGRAPLQPDTRADEAAETFVWNQRSVQRGFDTPLLFGGLTISAREGVDRPYKELMQAPRSERDLYNVALLVDEHGRVLGNYKKVFLLLFGEKVPLADTFPWIYDFIPEAGSFTAGTEPMVMELDGHRIGLMICYEDILPGFSRKLAHLQPQIIINVTNDAWFGKTSEPYLHLALSTLRAVETRTWLLRSTNTGVSAFIDANGRIVGETDIENAETISHEVSIMSGEKTVYTHIGDVLGWASLGASAILLVFAWREPEDDESDGSDEGDDASDSESAAA